MSGHVDTAILSAFSIGQFWYLPWLLFPESLAGLGEGSGQDVFLGLALVFGQLLIEVPTAGELFYELVAENSEGGYGPGGLGFLQGGWPLKHEQWDAHLAVSFEGGP
ncbi:hypothetical protein DY000_02007857 [Brassica cretica]|uniref:Chlorophyll a-b binding protein, chloroplastic n=1 Tax=Brassica cretica TaxID=69181 RepID=A0ABQ7CJR2_BRACR|nr:hypothetical protein DY000_02007857 [Brassica cretica]